MQARALAVVGFILLSGIGYNFWQRGKQAESVLTIKGRTPAVDNIQSEPRESTTPRLGDAKPALVAPANALAVVHIAGAVKNPGVYKFPMTARVDDAIKKAGGAKAAADLDAINLAERVEDGKQIFVPIKGAVTVGKELGGKGSNSAAGTPKKSAESTKAGKFTQPGKESLNINTANAELLQNLPGVGPAMADRIVSHRKENGPFSDPEQLMDVSGIGEKKFARMKPFVRVH